MRVRQLRRNIKRIVLILGVLFIAKQYWTFPDIQRFVPRLDKESVRMVLNNSLPTFESNEVKYLSFEEEKHQNDTGLCLPPFYLHMDEHSTALINAKKMLSYFKFGSEHRIAVPEWQRIQNREGRNSSTKYFLVAFLRVRLYVEDKARWTIKELKQWLHYQFWAGTEHIYICNHFLNESERLDIQLYRYVKLGLVTIFPWNHMQADPSMAGFHQRIMRNQIGCYNHIIGENRTHFHWYYTFDMDENPYVPRDRCEGFLSRYLRSLDNNTSGIIVANYVLQGQGDRSRDLIYDRIDRISKGPFNALTKPIARVSRTSKAGIHETKLTNGNLKSGDTRDIKMLHYWGARLQNWMADTDDMRSQTIVFNDVRDSIAIIIRHSLVAFGEFDAFSTDTGP